MVQRGPAYASQTEGEPRSLWCWEHRPRRLNPHYHPFIIVFFPLFFFFLSDILMAAVACNYVAIICFLASNWCSIAGMQSQIVSITLPLAWQAHLDYSQTSWSGDTLNVCLNFSWNPNNFYPFHSIHRHSFSHVCPTLQYRVIISLQSQSQEIIDMYFFLPLSIFFSSSQVDSLKSGCVWNHLIFISLSSLLIFQLCACHAFLTNPLSWLCDVL